jgi:hypothetical protein
MKVQTAQKDNVSSAGARVRQCNAWQSAKRATRAYFVELDPSTHPGP